MERLRPLRSKITLISPLYRPHSRVGIRIVVLAILSLTALFADAPARAVEATPATPRQLPARLRPVLYDALARNAGPAYAFDAHGCARLSHQPLTACFDRRGAHFSGQGAPLALQLVAWGRGGEYTKASPVKPMIAGNQVRYAHGTLTEWWKVLPTGFEQGFTVAKRPPGHGRLTLALSASDKASISPHSGTLSWSTLRYGKLVAIDADGKRMPAMLESKGDHIRITVNDAHAVYPLTVDPMVWLEQKATASDGTAGDGFGETVAVSGKIALVGAPNATVNGNQYQGAVYVFTKSNGVWSQSAKLTTIGGAAGDEFGSSVALDGSTALVGAPGASDGDGAAYAFDGSYGIWVQSQELMASNPQWNGQFGWSVALDGTTALISAVGGSSSGPPTVVHLPAVYVFNESSGLWSQTARLTASDGTFGDDSFFGGSLALDGSAALVGAPGEAPDGMTPPQGAVYVYTGSGGAWSQTAKLMASDGTAGDEFGLSVALDGSIALVGASHATVNGNANQGAAYVFTASPVWSQTAKITAFDGAADQYFGQSVALRQGAFSHLMVALVGGFSVYEFDKGPSWILAAELNASDGAPGDEFGFPLGFDGTTALVGAGAVTANSQGAAYFEEDSSLNLAVNAPARVNPGATFVSQELASNNASAASPAVSTRMAVPSGATYISAYASQGNCSEASGAVICNFGQLGGYGGTATANVTLKATGASGTMIENKVNVLKATPPLPAISLTETNHPPVAKDGTLIVKENTADSVAVPNGSGVLEATDVDGDPLTFSIEAQPSHGDLTYYDASTGAYSYTSNIGYSGLDSFTFEANDGLANSNTATVNIVVKPPPSTGGGGGSTSPLGLGLLAIGALSVWLKRKRRQDD